MKTSKPETAAQAYSRNLTDMLNKLESVKQYLYQTEKNPGDINWGHVGSMAHYNELLDQMAFAMGMTEYYEGKPVPVEA